MVMNDIDVKHNVFLFDKSKENDYEAHYFLWNDPKQKISMMFRYALLKKPLADESTVAVWGTFWDKNNPKNNISLIECYPLRALEILPTKTGISLGKSGMNENGVWGNINAGDNKLSWQFEVDKSNAVAVDRIQGVGEYHFFVNFASDYCRHKLNGWVQVNEDRYQIKDLPASDGHYSNIQNLVAWSWGNCVNFKEDPDFMFEGISAKYNDRTTPSLWLFFYWEGKRYETNVIDSMFIHHDVHSELERWAFIAEKNDVRFECELSADPQDMVLLTHPLPNGSSLYTTITLSANMKVDIFRKSDNGWNKISTMNANRTATFEVTKSVRNPAVKREFRIIQKT